MSKKIKTLITILIGGILLVGCDDTPVQTDSNINTSTTTAEQTIANKENNTDLIEILNNAKEITVKEKVFSIGVGYDVYADEKLVGEIKGKIIKDFGDKFKLIDTNGNTVKEEKQIKRWGVRINRMAEVSTPDGNVTGYIGEERIKDFFTIGYRFHIYNENKEEIGYTKEKLTFIGKEFDIYDMEDNKDYDIDKKVFNFTSTYKIKINDTSDIPVEDVIFYTAIQDCILSADEEKEAESKK